MNSKIQKNAIIIGGTSGIGRALVETLVSNGYAVGITGRRNELLAELKNQHGDTVVCVEMDVCKPETAQRDLESLFATMGDIDLLIISAGTGFINPELLWEPESTTIATNVTGFAAIATTAMKYFLKRGSGHLIGISSIAAIRGSSEAPAYNASKAFAANYLEGLRVKARKSGLPVFVTDVIPGFVATRMAQGEGLFWVAAPEKAAEQIFAAIQAKKRRIYITRRWRLIAWLMKLLPDFLYEKI